MSLMSQDKYSDDKLYPLSP